MARMLFLLSAAAVSAVCFSAVNAHGVALPTTQQKALLRVERDASPDCIYTHDKEPQNNPAILLPLYHTWNISYDPSTNQCTDSYFLHVGKGCRAVTAIVNPFNGPYPDGHPGIAGLRACGRMLSDHGVRMVGYVKTKQSKRDPVTGVWTPFAMQDQSTIQGEMNLWANQMAGISTFAGYFFDDTTNYADTVNMKWGVDHIAFYRNLINYARTVIPSSFIVLNPGVFVHLALVTPSADFPYPANVSIPFENWASKWRPAGNDCSTVQWKTTNGNFGPGPWCPYVPVADHVEPFMDAVSQGKTTVAAMAHSTPVDFAFNEAPVAQQAHFRYFFATDRNIVDDPWAEVPSFWDSYLRFLDAGEAKAVPTTTAQSGTTSAATTQSDSRTNTTTVTPSQPETTTTAHSSAERIETAEGLVGPSAAPIIKSRAGGQHPNMGIVTSCVALVLMVLLL